MIEYICLFIMCVIISAGLGVFINWVIKKWYEQPIKEVNEGPYFYAVKVLHEGDY